MARVPWLHSRRSGVLLIAGSERSGGLVSAAIMSVRAMTLAAIAIVFANGCVSTYQQAGVEQLAPGQTVSIEMDNPTCFGFKGCVSVTLVDGKSRGIGWFGKFELVPGPHEITCVYIGYNERSEESAVLKFTAEAGHTYRINANVWNMKWHPQIMDAQDNRVVSMVRFTS
jgi:hypothetical protein